VAMALMARVGAGFRKRPPIRAGYPARLYGFAGPRA